MVVKMGILEYVVVIVRKWNKLINLKYIIYLVFMIVLVSIFCIILLFVSL